MKPNNTHKKLFILALSVTLFCNDISKTYSHTKDELLPRQEGANPQIPAPDQIVFEELKQIKEQADAILARIFNDLLEKLDHINKNLAYWNEKRHESRIKHFLEEPIKFISKKCSLSDIDYYVFLFSELEERYAAAVGYTHHLIFRLKDTKPSLDLVAELNAGSETLTQWLENSPFKNFVVQQVELKGTESPKNAHEALFKLQNGITINNAIFDKIIKQAGRANHFQRNWVKYGVATLTALISTHYGYTYFDKIMALKAEGIDYSKKIYSNYISNRITEIKNSLTKTPTEMEQLTQAIESAEDDLKQRVEKVLKNTATPEEIEVEQKIVLTGSIGPKIKAIRDDPKTNPAALQNIQGYPLWDFLKENKLLKNIDIVIKEGGEIEIIKIWQQLIPIGKGVKRILDETYYSNRLFFAIVPTAILGFIGIYIAKKITGLAKNCTTYLFDYSKQKKNNAIRAIHGLDTSLMALPLCSKNANCDSTFGRQLYYLHFLEGALSLLPPDKRILLYKDIEIIRDTCSSFEQKRAAIERIKQFFLPIYQTS